MKGGFFTLVSSGLEISRCHGEARGAPYRPARSHDIDRSADRVCGHYGGDLSVGSSTLPGRELHPLKSSVFHGALFANCDPSRGHDERHCPADDLRASLQHVRAIRKIHTQA